MISCDSPLESIAYIHRKGAVSLGQWRSLLESAVSHSTDRLLELWAIRAGENLEEDRDLIVDTFCDRVCKLTHSNAQTEEEPLYSDWFDVFHRTPFEAKSIYPNLCQLLRFDLNLGFARYERLFWTIVNYDRGARSPELLEQVLTEHQIDLGMNDCSLLKDYRHVAFNRVFLNHLAANPVFYRGSLVHYLQDEDTNLCLVVSRERLPEKEHHSIMIDEMWIYSQSFIIEPNEARPFRVRLGGSVPITDNLPLVDVYYGDDLAHLRVSLSEPLIKMLESMPLRAKSARSAIGC